MPEQRVFLREATGLVREAGASDILALASMNISWGLSAFWYFFWGPYYSPGGDLNLGITLVLIPMLFGSVVWAMMATIMPRSGGDYIFNSRILHPLLGFLSSLGWLAVNFIWCATLSAYVSSPALTSLAYLMGWSALGAFAASGMGIFIVGTLVIAGFTLILIYGMKLYLNVQMVMFGFGVLWFLIIWGLLATHTHADFVNGWNTLSAQYGSGTYDQINSAAQTAGISTTFSLQQTFLLMPVAFWGLGYPYFAAFIAGETKTVHKSTMIGMPLALGLCGVAWYITNYLLQGVVGQQFLANVAYVAGNGVAPYTVPFLPNFEVFAAVLTNNSILIFLIGFGFIAWNILYAALGIIGQSRISLAWAFDRLAPPIFADVSERTHTPWKNMTIFAIGGEILLFIYAFYAPSILVSYTAVIPQILTTFILTAIAAIVIPYRKKLKRVYEMSVASKYKIGSIPFITICGVIYLGILITVLYYYFINAGLGALYIPSLAVTGAIYGFGVVYFYAVRAYRMKQGIDIRMAFSELPPE
jgi:amino acid transporter